MVDSVWTKSRRIQSELEEWQEKWREPFSSVIVSFVQVKQHKMAVFVVPVPGKLKRTKMDITVISDSTSASVPACNHILSKSPIDSLPQREGNQDETGRPHQKVFRLCPFSNPGLRVRFDMDSHHTKPIRESNLACVGVINIQFSREEKMPSITINHFLG